jgi:hypothetical protein
VKRKEAKLRLKNENYIKTSKSIKEEMKMTELEEGEKITKKMRK